MSAPQRRQQNAVITSKIEKVAEAFELPREIMAGTLKVTIIGNDEMTAEGILSVIEYTENTLSLSAPSYILTVTGENFEVFRLEKEYLKLYGKINSVSYII